jgi:predicted enzyme related to lactoylglutathione lyase
VESVESTGSSLSRHGGSIVLGPVPIPDGSIAIALDPLGAEFALFEGETDP